MIDGGSTKKSRKRRILFAGAVLCSLAVLWVAVVWQRQKAPPPTYEERMVMEWVTSPQLMGQVRTSSAGVNLAVLMLGEQAVPPLTKILRGGSKLNRIISYNSPRWLQTRWPWGRMDYNMKERAMRALATLGGMGRAAAPDLLRLVQDKTEGLYLRRQALSTLAEIHADPSLVLPILDKLKSDSVMSTVATNYTKVFQTHVNQNPIIPRKSNKPISPAFLTQTSLWNSARPRRDNSSQSLTNLSIMRP